MRYYAVMASYNAILKIVIFASNGVNRPPYIYHARGDIGGGRCSAYVFPALNPFRLTFLRMRESDTTLVAMRDVYFSHPRHPPLKPFRLTFLRMRVSTILLTGESL